MGKVYLVGAGPGDINLLTIKAMRLLKEADVVIYDRLIPREIISLANPDAKLIYVGKTSGFHKVKQDGINEILVREGKKSDKVVRLKGGDPFLFGRGGEEISALIENGVDFEEVPGVTSAIAAPAYAGIPVTHRDFCSSVHIITGHVRKGGELKIDFDALVRLNGTLVFMMGVGSAGFLAKGLLDAGMRADTSCAVVERGTLGVQRKFIGNLSAIEEIIKTNKVIPPSVIIVGDVCRFSEDFDWFSSLPLKGKKFLVSIPVKKSSEMAMHLRNLGAEVDEFSTIDTKFIRPIDPPLQDYDTLIFTSSVGVQSFLEDYYAKGFDARSLFGKKIGVIGKPTGIMLKKYGINYDFVPSIYSVSVMAKEMIESGFINKESKVLLLRVLVGSQDIIDIFDKEGIHYLDYAIYENVPIDKNNSIWEKPSDLSKYDAVVFTSSSGVKGFVDFYKKADFKNINALCIGEKTADVAKENGFNTIISEEASYVSMVEKALEVWSRKV